MNPTTKYATKAGAAAALKAARQVSESVSPQERERLHDELSELADASKAMIVALARLRSGKVQEKRRNVIVHPPPGVLVARRLIQTLRDAASLSRDELAARLKTTSDEPDFDEALTYAIDDQWIIVDGDGLRSRTAESMLESHPLVRETGEVENFETQIIEAIHEAQAMTLNELRAMLGTGNAAGPDTLVAFEAGLDEAIAHGYVEWLPDAHAPSLYAMPREAIEREPAENVKQRVDVARHRLWRATKTLGAELLKLRRELAARRRGEAAIHRDGASYPNDPESAGGDPRSQTWAAPSDDAAPLAPLPLLPDDSKAGRAATTDAPTLSSPLAGPGDTAPLPTLTVDLPLDAPPASD